MSNITLKIDGIEVSVKKGTTILDAAKTAGIEIPTLCYMENIHKEGICRICLVDAGRPNLLASCILIAEEGMDIKTNTPKIRKARKTNLELILSSHVKNCLSCERSTDCELQHLAAVLGVNADRFEENIENRVIDSSSYSIVRDSGKCILCRRCISACHNIQTVYTIGVLERGSDSHISPADLPLGEAVCVNCGQCAAVCPVNAIYEKDEMDDVQKALDDPSKFVVVQTAPAIRAALGETQGLPVGTCVTKKMTTALKMLGFDAVFDTNFTADLTIIEEGYELLDRLKRAIADKDDKVKLPMMTSCSPGWVKFLEHYFPDFTDNLSTAKSPQQMMGAVIKSYYAINKGINPKDIVVVSIMPCTAKKFEARRPEMNSSGFQDVDFVMTTRELGKFIKRNSIDFTNLPDSEFDDPLGESTGAADIFANSGGVMEAALRTVYELVSGEDIPGEKLHVKNLMDIHGVREISITIDKVKDEFKWLKGVELKVAAASGLSNARALMEKVSENPSLYHFIEIMACPGGCIGGGGQPRLTDDKLRYERFKAIKTEDESKKIRKSHENNGVERLYKIFLENPNSSKAHKLLHTSYKKRGI